MRDDHYPQIQTGTGGIDIFGVLWRRKWLILCVMALCVTGGVLAKRFMTPMWRAEAGMILVNRAGFMRTGQEDYTPLPGESVETQIGMLQTAEMDRRTEDWLKNKALKLGQDQNTYVMPLSELQSAVTVTSPKGSTLINVGVSAKSRDQALVVADAIVQSFVVWKRDLAQDDVQKTLVTLQKQTVAARSKMEAVLQKQLAYQNANKIVNASAQASGILGQLQARETDISGIQEELKSQQARTALLAAQLNTANRGIQISGGGRNDAITNGLQAQLNELQVQRNLAAQRVTPAYPGTLPLLDSQIKDIEQRLAKRTRDAQDGTVPSLGTQDSMLQNYQQAKIALGATQARLEEAIRARNVIAQKMNSLPQTGSDVEELARQSDMAIANYTKLQNALGAAQLESNKINGNVQISQEAIASDAPFKPNSRQNILISALLGAFLSLGLALLVDNFNRRVRSEGQMERLGAGPILGALPTLSRSALTLLQHRQLPAPVAETYSLTSANLLRVLGPVMPGSGRIVLITSAQAGEGKSLTAVETARALARSGKRVILVDTDLRQPTLKGLFAETREVGLIEVLAGQVSLQEALVKSETPNLSVLFGSAAKVNSADVLASAQMLDFLQQVRGYAEIVILDAPSCTVVDPLLLAPHVDYVMQVVNLGRAGESAVYGTVSALTGLAPLGFFINRTSKKNAPAYEVARSFAVTAYPRLTADIQTQALPSERAFLMYQNAATHTQNGSEADAENGTAAHTDGSHSLAIPLNSREDR